MLIDTFYVSSFIIHGLTVVIEFLQYPIEKGCQVCNNPLHNLSTVQHHRYELVCIIHRREKSNAENKNIVVKIKAQLLWDSNLSQWKSKT